MIYLHRNLLNGKVYIGQTTQLPSQRWKNGHGYSANMHFRSAINKYGWDNFEHIILEDFNGTPEEAAKKEQEYIIIYNSLDPNFGYNIKPADINITKTMRKRCIEWMKNHPEFGLKQAEIMHEWQITHPEEFAKIKRKFQKNGAKAKAKPVRCIETNTIYESASEAARKNLNTTQSKITMCCRG